MRKSIVFSLSLFLLIGILAPPALSAQVYLDQVDTGVETVLVENRNYVAAKHISQLLKQEDTQMEFPEFLVSLRDVANHGNYYIQRDSDAVYLNTLHPDIDRTVIGYSVQGRPIETVYMTPPNYNQTILAVFALHGFEDNSYRDGERLTQVAEQLSQRISAQPELLNFTRVIIVICANPDGVYAGITNNGFGRCNAQGIDLNRDFDFNWGYIQNSRFHTGNKPFSAPESQLLRDLVLTEKPDIVLDFHGWLNCCYSPNPELRVLFAKTLHLGIEKPALPGYNPQQGYFSFWASQYAKAALVEYPYSDVSLLTEQTIQVLQQLM